MNKSKRQSLNFETSQVSRDELAFFLLKTASKTKLVNRKVKDFSSHPQFSVIYNKEELTEILNITIAKVINAHEAYILKKLGKEIPEGYPNIGADLDLSSFGNVTGYMRSAYDNNVSKDYKRHIAVKRSGDVVSYDSASQEDSNDNKQGNAILNQMFESSIEDSDAKNEYDRLIGEILSFLKKYDKKVNTLLAKKNKGIVRDEKKSKFAFLFIYLLNPKLKGKYVHIKDKLPEWTQYLFKKNKNELAEIIQANFPEEMKFLYTYLNESSDSYGETLRPKRTATYFDQSCDVTSSYSYIFKGKKMKVVYTIQMFRKNNGRVEILEEMSKSKISSQENLELVKAELAQKMERSFVKMKDIAERRRIKSVQAIYSKAA